MRITKSKLNKLKDYFAKQTDVVAVYLYGSFAEDRIHPRSDIDFGVLFNKPIKTFNRLGQVYSDLCDLKLPNEPDVRDLDLKESPAYLMNVIKGKLIYSRDDNKRVEFEVEVLRRYYDTERLRQIRFYYLDQRLKDGTYGY